MAIRYVRVPSPTPALRHILCVMPVLVPSVVPSGAMAAIEQPTISCPGGYVLRPWRDTDSSSVLAAFADVDIQQWHRLSMASLPEAGQWIRDWPSSWRAESAASWAVTTPDGFVAGQAGLRHIELRSGRVECSYWTLPGSRRRGAASSATLGLAAWVFGLGMHRLELVHAVANTASCRVAQRCGFDYEGVLRSRLLLSDGWQDVHMHGLVASGQGTDATA